MRRVRRDAMHISDLHELLERCESFFCAADVNHGRRDSVAFDAKGALG